MKHPTDKSRQYLRKSPFGSSVPTYSIFSFYNNCRTNDRHFKNQTMQHLPGHKNEEYPAYPYSSAYPKDNFGYRPFLN